MPDPEKSKIKITAPKIPILFMSDWGDTGFGTVGKELMARLAEMEIFDVHYLGWVSRPEHQREASLNGIQLHNTQFWDAGDHFGGKTFNPLVDQLKPKVVITLGDPWMVDHVSQCPSRDAFSWIFYVPIDRDVVSKMWRGIMKKPDVLVLYSQFGMDVIKEMMPYRNPQLILHGVDKMCFKPWYPEGMDEDTPLDDLMHERKRYTMGEPFADKWIIGFVGRNQIRKAIPRAIRAFKAFNCETWCEKNKVEVLGDEGETVETYEAEHFCNNVQKFRCDVCPAFVQRPETEHTIIYLHTTRGDGQDPQDKPGIGWLIDELGERYNIQGRLGMTPSITVLKGLPRAGLAQLMNCFDVHLFLSHSEGFGLPIAESLSCGVPNLVTDYSSMPELISDGGGMAVEVKDFDTFTTWENDWALADVGDAATKLNEIFTDKELYASMREAAAKSEYTPHWDVIAMQFREMILNLSR